MGRMVRDGASLSVAASIYLLALLRWKPRIFLRHYPKVIRELVPPKSRRELQVSALLGVPFGVLSLGYIFVSALLWRNSPQGISSFRELFTQAFGVFFFFNLVDLLILDWLIVCWYAPGWVTIPGTEHVVIPGPYLHHFKGFLAGIVVCVVGGLAVATLLQFWV